ncbi:MAG: bifunctional lysine ketoglutarate reductase /saccharopine dehydrogenase family protein [Acidobacteriota bacterium]|nr:bifunctional lysine ketoglutarate reductase /saccharopine dehydrogenase family protein [Acidobacteriota bacterium]
MRTKIAVRREDINRWEKRAPLIPSHVRELIANHPIDVWVQPSKIRVFADGDYEREGARIEENICPCRIVFGLKEIPLDLLEKNKIYVFFSHTAKGQPHNMPMLRKMMDLGCSLIDYEKMADDKGRRVLFFGSFAGHAGMVDTLWALGRRLSVEGIKTPFLSLRQIFRYQSLVEAKEEVAKVGWKIRKQGLPPSLAPLVCGFLGYGHVSRGAQEIFDLLPVESIRPADVPALFKKRGFSAHRLYKAVFREEDMVRTRQAGGVFDLQDYYRNPGRYKPVVESYLPYLTVLVNGIFWSPMYPRFVTRKFIKKLYGGAGLPRLKVIGDITCDIEGSIECNVRATGPDDPVYVYDPAEGKALSGFQGKGPVVLAVYNLPAELPLESSVYFSQTLKSFVPPIASADFDGGFAACRLPDEVKKAVILFKGRLTPDYAFLKDCLPA